MTLKITTKRWPLAIALVLWAGCGGSANYGPAEAVEPERENPALLESDQIERFEQLGTALASPEVDCSSACDLSDSICGLTSRICGIADRHPGDEATGDRCRDASIRCERGRERVAESCTCETP